MENQATAEAGQPTAAVMSVKEWVVTLIITVIPFINIIMLFVWAFSSGNNPNKANWAKGTLIIMVVLIALYIVIFAIFGAAFLGSMGGGGEFKEF